MARYVGVLTGKSVDHLRKVVSGQGMSLWLADSDGKGDLLETPVAITAQTFANAIRAILGSGMAVVEGTLFSGIAGTYTAATCTSPGTRRSPTSATAKVLSGG
ncbi:hypothetical protein GCM10022224_095230 [Nonomuraea antimicrobica]|uniref:Uncharacterized protein n=1 Tax=Nonomuraea antimicrobica TaxID=561173 RepID=A0ABP7E587_9ACTN